METSLHRQLKERFRLPDSQIEVKVGRYRIDVVTEGRLIEIQQSGLSAIRDKINRLLAEDYVVEVVKPLVARKRIIKLSRKNGGEIHRRWSPKRANELTLFDELIYFTRVFPHPNLKLVVPLVEIEELRYPGHGRRRRWRSNDYLIKDRLLVKMVSMQTYDSATDLHRLLPPDLESPFDTKQLAERLGINRYDAQRIGYVLRKTGSAIQVGKRGNAVLYELVEPLSQSVPVKQKLVELPTIGPEPTERKAKKSKRSVKKAPTKKSQPRKKTTTKKPARAKPKTRKRSAA